MYSAFKSLHSPRDNLLGCMEKKVFGLQLYAKYLNVSGVKDDNIHVVQYANEKEQRLKSDLVHIDFYMLSIKPILHKNLYIGCGNIF